MAQSTARKSTQNNGKNTSASMPPPTPPRRRWPQLATLARPFIVRPTATQPVTGTNGKPRKTLSNTFRFFVGLLIFVIGSQAFAYVLAAVDAGFFHQQLETTTLAPKSTPLLGGLTPFLLLYLLAVIAIWALLYKFNIIPKDPFGVKAQTAARASGRTGTGATPPSSTAHTRRRHGTANSTTTVRAEPARRTTNGVHDDAYERVRAEQRTRRRRASRR